MLTYQNYIKVDKLVRLQKLLSTEHDEMQFIIVHQVFELWFKLIIHELEAVKTNMLKGNIKLSVSGLKRIQMIQKNLINHFSVIETMRPEDFFRFRTKLEPASGIQSVQFREIEYLSGLKDNRYLKLFDKSVRDKLERRIKELSIWDVFVSLVCNGRSKASDSEITMQCMKPKFRQLTKELWKYDMLFKKWRKRHVLMTRRIIGNITGTGKKSIDKIIKAGYKQMGSGGIDYLKTTLNKIFYPLLWPLSKKLQ